MNANRNRFFNSLLWLMIAFGASFSIYAQKPKPPVTVPSATIENYKLNSKLMAREMPYRVVLPVNYAKKKLKDLSVIYLLHGLSGHFDNWTNKTKLAEYAAKYSFIIVTPEGDNGWYTDSASENNDRYESYIIEELIPEIDKKFRTLADKKHRAVAGLSMGGYGSIKFGLKYPEMFELVGSFSGALGVASLTENDIGSAGEFAKTILNTFGKAGSKTRNENDVFKIAGGLSKEKIKALPFMYLDTGTEDFVLKSNREFVDLLLLKKIPHEYRQLPGGHNWTFWDTQVQEFLRLAEKYLK